MSTSNNEIEFFSCNCGQRTDLICVSCDKWFCDVCLSTCVQCKQVVCEECYKEDICCLVRPWGEKQERHLRDFYQNKLLNGEGIYVVSDHVTYGNEHRMEAVKRSISYFVDNFDASSFFRCKEEHVREFFPNIAKYVENESMHRDFVEFMKIVFRISRDVFSYIFLNNAVREELLSVMDESIRSNEDMQRELIVYAMQSKELFHSLKNRGLLDQKLAPHYHRGIYHVDALKWIEENEIDVANNREHFERFVQYSPVEIMEYLIVEKGMTVEYMSENSSYILLDILRMIFRLRGIEGIQKIYSPIVIFDFEEVKFLKSIGYDFDKHLNNAQTSAYAFVCFNIWKYEDLEESKRKEFDDYVCFNDMKACKHLYPFMREIRKRKIMTVILCIRNLYPFFQKEIIWNILDLAYSPINERGSL